MYTAKLDTFLFDQISLIKFSKMRSNLSNLILLKIANQN